MPDTALTVVKTPVAAQISGNPLAAFTDPEVRGYLMEVAESLATATIIPANFQRKPADCFLALHIAARMGADPIVVMQNLYVIQGKPGWNASFAIAQANASGVFSDRITYQEHGKGDDLRVRASATLASTGEVVHSITVSMVMAKAEGWAKNKKYQTMPELMLRYRAATFLIRQFCPEVLLGMSTAEEVADVAAAEATPREPIGAGMAGLGAALAHDGGAETDDPQRWEPPAFDPESGEILDNPPLPDDE